jgi:hypothetical protein
MPTITWGDDSTRGRLFQTGLRIAAHFYDAVGKTNWASDQKLLQHLEDLNKRWLIVAGGPEYEVAEYATVMAKELMPWEGQPLFDHIRSALAKPFAPDRRLEQVNQRALDQARECIKTWGGPKAKKRIGEIGLLPVSCKRTAADDTQFSFDRESILVQAGSHELLLLECMLLEFSFFHEYLSHAFPPWSRDHSEISEGFLFALEFEWLQSNYTLFDNDLLQRVWHPRLEKERDSFRTAQWLFRRCGSYECVFKFLLEWVAGWQEFSEDKHEDLLSQINGSYNKGGREIRDNNP